MKTLFLANNVYGKHGGPYQPGTALGLLFHLLSGGEHELQGFSGHVIGGMGAITAALAAAGLKRGVEIRKSAPVAKILSRNGGVQGVVLEDGTEIKAKVVLSNADPKRTFLGLVESQELPDEFRNQISGIKMAGPCAKVNFVLSEEPRVKGMSSSATPAERSLFTLLPSLEFAERCYDIAKFGDIPEELWVDCVVASNVDDTLAPKGRHVMTTFVQYVPYKLRHGTWDENRELLGEGDIFHGDLTVEQLFFMRPGPGWAQYRTPIKGLYLCGAGAHPGGGVTDAPGHNAARQVLRDLRRKAS